MKNKKTIALIVSMILVLGAAIGGTVAWLQDVREDTQTFSGGDHVYIADVAHSTIQDAKVIPGKEVSFDPAVTVDNSVDAYLFIEFGSGAEYLNLDSASLSGWTALSGTDGVYYREIGAKTGMANNSVPVFTDGKVRFSSELTNSTIPTEPVTISVKAYAIQKDYIGDVNAAWQAVSQP